MKRPPEAIEEPKKETLAQMWAVAALLMAEKKFKRVKGYREIPKLIVALGQKNLDGKEVAA